MILAMILATIFLTGDARQPAVTDSAAFKSVACDFLTYDNAFKLIGKSTGADSGMEDTAEGRKWGCTFTASDIGDKPRKLYFTMIKSSSDDGAKQAFDSIRQSNKSHAGFEEWPGVGDEAVVHSDPPNFHFVMVRKGVKAIRVKVNPAAGVSLDELKNVVVSLTGKL
jgi:hypothetical protein